MSAVSTLKNRKNLILWGLVSTFCSLLPTAYATAISNSAVLFADFLRCFAEFLAIFLAWLVSRKILREDQSTFNFGFGKLEQLASLAVAIALFVTFLISFSLGIYRVLQPATITGSEFGFAFACASVIGNLFLWLKNYLHWKTDISPIIESQWKLFRAKTLATVVVSISVGSHLYLPEHRLGVYLDPVGSITLSVFLLHSAYSMISHTMTDLLDRAIDEKMQMVIMRALVEHETQYHGLGNIRSRRAGAKIFVDIFLEFEADLSFSEVHRGSMLIKKRIESELSGTEVTIIPSLISS